MRSGATKEAASCFHVVTELTCKNGEDEFRPDITLLINGMPLVFIEVKIPYNQGGVLWERERMVTRFSNKKFHWLLPMLMNGQVRMS